jgi:hypothetical protein
MFNGKASANALLTSKLLRNHPIAVLLISLNLESRQLSEKAFQGFIISSANLITVLFFPCSLASREG